MYFLFELRDSAMSKSTAVDVYWREIKDVQPLSRADEVTLFEQARNGDEEAREN